MKTDLRKLRDLEGIGKAAAKDFQLLGISSVGQLAEQDPEQLFISLYKISGAQDICVLDVLRCAVAQAKDPSLPAHKRKWWYWSKIRKRNVDA